MNAQALTEPKEFAKALLEMSGITKKVLLDAYLEKMEHDYSKQVLLWEVKDLEKATTFKGKALEEKFLQDPRILQYQRQETARGKRVWLREPTAKAVLEIVEEWICIGAVK